MNTEHSTKGVDPAEKRCRGEDILKSWGGGTSTGCSAFCDSKGFETES